VGTAAHGAVLYTASGAAMRGMKVVVPAGRRVRGGALHRAVRRLAPRQRPGDLDRQMTLTTLDGVKF
jgi:hypothetical protein